MVEGFMIDPIFDSDFNSQVSAVQFVPELVETLASEMNPDT